jgi:hypothetical protein
MLSHDLATTFVAERDRVIREATRARTLPARPSVLARIVARLAVAARPRPEAPVARPRPSLVTGVSAGAGDTHGQGAC